MLARADASGVGLSEGKTTAMRLLAGKLKPNRGKIEILADGADDAAGADDQDPTAAPSQAANQLRLRRAVNVARLQRGALAAFTLSAVASPLQTAADVLRGAGPSAWLDRLVASAQAASKVAAGGVAGMLPHHSGVHRRLCGHRSGHIRCHGTPARPDPRAHDAVHSIPRRGELSR